MSKKIELLERMIQVKKKIQSYNGKYMNDFMEAHPLYDSYKQIKKLENEIYLKTTNERMTEDLELFFGIKN